MVHVRIDVGRREKGIYEDWHTVKIYSQGENIHARHPYSRLDTEALAVIGINVYCGYMKKEDKTVGINTAL